MTKPNRRSFYTRVLAGFLAFYLLAMLAVTGVQYYGVRQTNTLRMQQLLQSLEDEGRLGTASIWEEQTPPVSFGGLWSSVMTKVRQAPFAAKLYCFDPQGNLLGQSGTYLSVGQEVEVTAAPGATVTIPHRYGFRLDAVLDEQQLLALYPYANEHTNHLSAEGTQYRTMVRAHLEGLTLVPSEVLVWQTDSSGRLHWRADAEPTPVLRYALGPIDPRDTIMICAIEWESFWPTNSPAPVYDRQVQQAFRASGQIMAGREANGLLSPEENTTVQAYTYGDASKLIVIKRCALSIEGQSIGYLIAAAETNPLAQAASALWPLYATGLAIALVLACLMARQLDKLQQGQRRLEESRQALLIAVAHELKQPLSVIKSYSQGLLEDIAADKRADYLAVIIDETDQMNDMVVELLTLTRLTTDGSALRRETVEIGELLRRMLPRYQRQLDEKRLQVTLDTPQPVSLSADGRLLEQAVANLLSNAIRHSPEAGRITITLTPERLSVANPGPLIDDVHWPHLFEPFYKVESSRADSGTGLGLAIVRAIADLHGMTVEGHNEEAGVAFTLHFGPGSAEEEHGGNDNEHLISRG